MIYDIEPVAKPRMTQRDKWAKRPCVMKYRDFKDQVKLNRIDLPECGAHITFIVPMPKSWSKKRRAEMNLRPHQQKPDLDNFVKALLDAVYEDDAHIWDIWATKVWGYAGEIMINCEGK